jgi:hypothetical protein
MRRKGHTSLGVRTGRSARGRVLDERGRGHFRGQSQATIEREALRSNADGFSARSRCLGCAGVHGLNLRLAGSGPPARPTGRNHRGCRCWRAIRLARQVAHGMWQLARRPVAGTRRSPVLCALAVDSCGLRCHDCRPCPAGAVPDDERLVIPPGAAGQSACEPRTCREGRRRCWRARALRGRCRPATGLARWVWARRRSRGQRGSTASARA